MGGAAVTPNERYEAHAGLVKACIKKYFPQYKHDEDMLQIARLALWEACLAHPDNLPAYAHTCIRNALYDEIRNRRNNWPLVLPSEDSPEESDMADGIHTDLDTDAAIDKLCGDDVRLKAIVYMRLAGLTLDEIGTKFNTSGTAVRRLLEQAKQKTEGQ